MRYYAQKRNHSVPAQLAILFLAGIAWLPPLAAQTPPGSTPPNAQNAPNAGQLLEQIRPPQPAPDAARPVLPPVQRAAVPDDATPVRVTGYAFSGNTVLSSAELQSLMDASLAASGSATTTSSTTFGALRRAADSITQAYAARGYLLARAVIARQDLAASTVLRIQVLEGTLGSLQLPPLAPANVQALASATFAAQGLQPGTPLQQAPLERGVLLLADRLGSPASVGLKAGSTLGSTDVVLQTRYNENNTAPVQPWRAQLAFDNFGNRYTGLWRAGADAALLSPTTLGDTLTLRTLLSSGLQYAAVGYQRPVGYDGWRLGANASALRYQLCCQFAALGAAGNAQTAALTARYPLLLAATRSLHI